ncbi:MAG: SpoIIIAH-like family protein [Bacillota bacterium]
MINIIANQEFKRKVGWFLVLMLWVGMVTAVITNELGTEDHLAEVSSAEGHGQVSSREENNSDKVEVTTSSRQSLNLSQGEQQTKKKDKDFFVEYRIERDQARSEQINLLREMINNPNSDKKVKTQAQSRLLAITNNIEQEMEIESLIRARGYQDGIAFIHNNSVEVIVATTGLTQEDVAKIGNIITNTTEIALKNVTIIEKQLE